MTVLAMTDTLNIHENVGVYVELFFRKIRASTLTLEDEFLQHKPIGDFQEKFKRSIENAIKIGIKDFYVQRLDPSMDDNNNIFYRQGELPAVKKTGTIWIQKAKEFLPEYKSSLGIEMQYDVYLGMLIKYLISEKKYTVESAWKAVCDDSYKLGNYQNSPNIRNGKMDTTGSRQVGEFFDLANTNKIITNNDRTKIINVGGNYLFSSKELPLAQRDEFEDKYIDRTLHRNVGWIVLNVEDLN